MKKKLISLAILTLLLASPINAADTVQCPDASERVTISVKGMVCDFCAQSLVKTLEPHASVKRVYIDLDHGRVTICLDENKKLDNSTIKDMKDMIESSGYNAHDIKR